MMSRTKSQPSVFPRLILALALVLAQSLVLAHQQDHTWTPEITVCEQCLSGQGLDFGISIDTCPHPVDHDSNTRFTAQDHRHSARPTPTSRLTRAPPSFSH